VSEDDAAAVLDGKGRLVSGAVVIEFNEEEEWDQAEIEYTLDVDWPDNVRRDEVFLYSGDGTVAPGWAITLAADDENYIKFTTFNDGTDSAEHNIESGSDYLDVEHTIDGAEKTYTIPVADVLEAETSYSIRIAVAVAEGEVNEKYTTCYDVITFEDEIKFAAGGE